MANPEGEPRQENTREEGPQYPLELIDPDQLETYQRIGKETGVEVEVVAEEGEKYGTIFRSGKGDQQEVVPEGKIVIDYKPTEKGKGLQYFLDEVQKQTKESKGEK